MDNNNNVSGIPNVSDIKFDDTPAESFENLYGGGSNVQQTVGNSSINHGPSMVPNPSMTMNQGPDMTPNPSMGSNLNQGSAMGPNPMPTPMPTPSVAPSMGNPVPTPNVAPSMGNPVPTPSVAPSMENSVQTPSVVPSMGTPVVPNTSTIVQPVEDLSNIDIDAEKMQSIEEQLSKTSQYNPADFQQEQMTISTDNQYEKNKSSLTFLIVLFVILGLTIILTPQIIKFIK